MNTAAAPDAALIAALRSWLAERRALWINQAYLHEGESAQRACFLKLIDGAVTGAVQLGFDDWLDRYEDAIDLYFRCERQRFDGLELALAYTFEQLPLRPGDFSRAMGSVGYRQVAEHLTGMADELTEPPAILEGL